MDDSNNNLKAGQAENATPNAAYPLNGLQKPPGLPPQFAKEILHAKAVAKKLKIPFLDPLSARIEPAAIALVNGDTARRLQAVPIRIVDNTVLVAMASPPKTSALRTLELLTACQVRPAMAPKRSLLVVLEKVYKKSQGPPVDPQKGISAGTARKVCWMRREKKGPYCSMPPISKHPNASNT